MSVSQEKTEKNSRPWLKIALVASLAINLLIVGFVAGAVARHKGEGGPSARNPGLGAFGAPYMRALPPEDRRAVFQALRDGGEVNLPDRRERREMFVAVVADLRARPFDPDALKATVAKQAEVAVQIQQRAQAAWLEAVADMTDTERLDYADAVDAVLRRKPSR